MVTYRCKKGCCSVTFCPLHLSFGMTLHTFQGQSAGPVDKGQPRNAVDTIIVDPGTRSFEGNNPGTAYMAVSRPTTMGSGNLDSALYFTGPNMKRSRILNIQYQLSSLLSGNAKKLYKKVFLRKKWIAWLDERTISPEYSDQEIDDIKEWCETFRMNASDLDSALSRRNWRTNMRKSVNY